MPLRVTYKNVKQSEGLKFLDFGMAENSTLFSCILESVTFIFVVFKMSGIEINSDWS